MDGALEDYYQQKKRYRYLKLSADESERAMKLARLRYENGYTNFLDVLDAERTLLEAQNELAISETLLGTSLVSVYKSLGGGWEIYDENQVSDAGQPRNQD